MHSAAHDIVASPQSSQLFIQVDPAFLRNFRNLRKKMVFILLTTVTDEAYGST